MARDMGFPGRGTHITRVSQGGEDISSNETLFVFSVIHVSVDIKFSRKKDSALLFGFSL